MKKLVIEVVAPRLKLYTQESEKAIAFVSAMNNRCLEQTDQRLHRACGRRAGKRISFILGHFNRHSICTSTSSSN